MTAPMTPGTYVTLTRNQVAALQNEAAAPYRAEVDRLSSELARVTAERDRMRPVYDAAMHWHATDGIPSTGAFYTDGRRNDYVEARYQLTLAAEAARAAATQEDHR